MRGKDTGGYGCATWNDLPSGLSPDVSFLSSCERIASKCLTVSTGYILSPHLTQTSARTFISAVSFPPRNSFSTIFSDNSPPQRGHFSNGQLMEHPVEIDQPSFRCSSGEVTVHR